MKLCIVLLVILCWYFQARVVCIPLQQFLPFGPTAGDERTTFLNYDVGVIDADDGTSGLLMLNPSYPIIGNQTTSLHVNVNGVISIQEPFYEYLPQVFPYTNGEILICPFWDDVRIQYTGSIYHNNGSADGQTKSRVSLLIQEKLRFNFDPTGVFIATWDAVSFHQADSNINLGKNTFQCVLATNGQDTFILFLYADGLIQWTRGYDLGGYTQVGVDGGDGVNYYSVPNSLTPEIINIAHTSNVNTSGLWILKVDSTIITGLPSAPSDLVVVETGATEITLGWTHNSTNAAESFTVNCTTPTQDTIATMIAEPRPTVLEDSDNITTTANTTFAYTIPGLQEYTNYTCTVSARNVFGWSPTSDIIEFMTNSSAPSGPPEDITAVYVSSSTLQLEWGPPSEEDRNGVITGYRVLLEWGTGLEHRVHTTDTHYTFTGLQQGTTYYYRIAAETSEGTGPFSNRTTVDTPTGEPTMGTEPLTTLQEELTNPDISTTSGTVESTVTQSTTIIALNIGVVGGAGGAAVLLLTLITATIVALCVIMHKRKKANFNTENVVSTTKEEEINIYDEVSQTPNTELKPPTTQPMPSQTAFTTKFKAQTPNHYTVKSDHHYEPQVKTNANPYTVSQLPKSQKGAKKPMMPPNKPRSASSAGSKQAGSSDGVYMALNPATMGRFQPSQDTEYMTISDATRREGIQNTEAPQYMNCQTALGNRYRPTETAKL